MIVAALDADRLKHVRRSLLADVRALLGRRIPQARQILRKLVVGRVLCEPFGDGGFEPVFWALRGPIPNIDPRHGYPLGNAYPSAWPTGSLRADPNALIPV
jgi:hypothetical protein